MQEAMEPATLEITSQQGGDDSPLSSASQRKRIILITLQAIKPKEGKVFTKTVQFTKFIAVFFMELHGEH